MFEPNIRLQLLDSHVVISDSIGPGQKNWSPTKSDLTLKNESDGGINRSPSIGTTLFLQTDITSNSDGSRRTCQDCAILNQILSDFKQILRYIIELLSSYRNLPESYRTPNSFGPRSFLSASIFVLHPTFSDSMIRCYVYSSITFLRPKFRSAKELLDCLILLFA